MAEGASFDLAGKVLELLGSLIVQEVKLASSVKTEMENLRNTVSYFCKLLILVIICNFYYFRFMAFISLFLRAFNVILSN